MSDLISRQAALDIIDAELSGWLTDDEWLHLEGVGTGIECLPTIDPVKRGRWKIEREPSGVRLMVCDCGYRFPAVLGLYHFKYCPNCGARMVDDEAD